MKTSNPFIAFLKVLRPINLAIIALTMYMIRYFIFQRWLDFDISMYMKGYMKLPLSHLDFGLLVFSVVCVAAAGYIINDYFDLRADRINKPERVIIGRLVKRRVAMATHFTLNSIGVALGFYIAFKVGNWKLGFFNVFATAMLWFYSVQLKRQYLIGNLTIAVLAGIIPIMLGKYELPWLINEYSGILQETLNSMATYQQYQGFFTDYLTFFNYLMYWATAYAVFAFLATLVREIIKDMADIEGDSKVGCRTIPIVMGMKFTKGLVAVLVVIILLGLTWAKHNFIDDDTATIYFMVLLGAPLIGAAVITVGAQTRKRFLLASNLVKIAMLAAVMFAYFVLPNG